MFLIIIKTNQETNGSVIHVFFLEVLVIFISAQKVLSIAISLFCRESFPVSDISSQINHISVILSVNVMRHEPKQERDSDQ